MLKEIYINNKVTSVLTVIVTFKLENPMTFKLSKPHTSVFLALMGSQSLLLSHASIAQEAEESNKSLEVIQVTAQKRVENVQEVPITISAMSANGIKSNDIGNVTEISAYIPNVEMDATSPFAGSSSVLSAFIRGIGQNDFAFNLEPGVGLYVDGVYYARTLGAVVDTLNLERIEVLKGPQGTLFGRNSIGGALNIVTSRPSDNFGFQSEVTTGSFNRQDIRVSADLPISDDLLTQVSFSSKRRDGFQQRIPFPGSELFVTDARKFVTIGNQQSYGDEAGAENGINGRFKALYTLSDDVNITFSADFTETDESAAPSSLIAIDPNASLGSLYNTCISLDVATLQSIGLGAACGPRATLGTGLAGVNVDDDPSNDRLPLDDRFITNDPDISYAGGSNFSELSAWGSSIIIDWDLGDDLALKSITAYRDLESSFGVDNSGTPHIMVDTSFFMEQDQFSQELQLTGTSMEDKLEWVTGLYYFTEDGVLIDTPIFAEGLVQVYGPNYLENEAIAAFAHLNYRFNEKWGATFGIRYTKEDKTFEGTQQELNQFGIKVGFPAELYPDQTDLTRVYPLGVNEQSFTDTSIHLGVQYHVADDIMTFASYSQGFKSGGWTSRLTVPEPSGQAPTFEPEEADSFEVGVKSRFWDGTAQLNAAIFHTEYDNIQVTVNRGLSPFFENAAKGEISGFELEGQFILSEDLYLNASYGFIDAEYTELNEGTLLSLDDKFVNTPENSASIGMRYHHLLESGAEWVFMGDWAFRSETANVSENTPGTNQPAYSLYNVSVKFVSDDGNWDIALRGENLTDERVIVTGFQNIDVGTTQVVYNPGRMWSLTLSLRY